MVYNGAHEILLDTIDKRSRQSSNGGKKRSFSKEGVAAGP